MKIARRQFTFTVGATAVAWPLSLHAQQSKLVPRIGVLLFGTPDTDPNLPAFLRGLRELGFVEGQNIAIEYRYAEGKPDRLHLEEGMRMIKRSVEQRADEIQGHRRRR